MQSPTVEEASVEQGPDQAEPVCRHHWLIQTPQGATSFGRCKLCQEVREFPNSSGDFLWEGDPMRSAGRMGNGRRSGPQANVQQQEE